VAERLGNALVALGSGGRMAPSRQRTLKATLDWSYDLLNSEEQLMLRRAGVFAGSFSLEAAEAVCGSDPLSPDDTVDLVSRLLDASLLSLTDGDPPRYGLAETTRQYALEKLDADGDIDEVRRRHAEFFRDLVAGGGSEGTQRDQALFLAALDDDHDNFGAALRWVVDRGETDLALGLVGNLVRFWYRRGYFGEAKGWLQAVMAMTITDPTAELANVTRFATVMAWDEGDAERGAILMDRAEAIARRLEDPGLIARSLNIRAGYAWRVGDLDAAAGLYRDAMAALAGTAESFTPRLLTNLADLLIDTGRFDDAAAACIELEEWLAAADATDETVDVVRVRAGLAFGRGNLDEAAGHAAEAISRYRELGLAPHLGIALKLLADIERSRGEAAAAAAAAQEAVELFTRIDDVYNAEEASLILADLHLEAGDTEDAEPLLRRALSLFAKGGRRVPMGFAIEGWARAAAVRGQWLRAAQLCGAAHALLQPVVERPMPRARAIDDLKRSVHRALGEEVYDGAFDEGAVLSPDQAVALALAGGPVAARHRAGP
jgi:non-specific serine/threonine protein kinase